MEKRTCQHRLSGSEKRWKFWDERACQVLLSLNCGNADRGGRRYAREPAFMSSQIVRSAKGPEKALGPSWEVGWIMSIRPIMLGWLRIREMGTPAVGSKAVARCTFCFFVLWSTQTVRGIWAPRKMVLSLVRSTEMLDVRDCGSLGSRGM